MGDGGVPEARPGRADLAGCWKTATLNAKCILHFAFCIATIPLAAGGGMSIDGSSRFGLSALALVAVVVAGCTRGSASAPSPTDAKTLARESLATIDGELKIAG